jgi:ribosomal protein L3 glutamine methyltransferase
MVDQDRPLTNRQALLGAATQLARARLSYGHGTQSALEDAAWLLSHALGIPPADLDAHLDAGIDGRRNARFKRLVDRRIREKVPVAYLIHEAWLGEHRFYVDKRVIVPRSFISELLDGDLQLLLQRPVKKALDLCTGSGCLAILLADTFPGARIDAVDLSGSALAVARRNIETHKRRSRISLVRTDLFEGLGRRKYDLIVSNPPYVDAPSMRRLPAEYRHEPVLALAGGTDGLELIRRILEHAKVRLNPGGALVCEIGHNKKALERAFPRLPFLWLETSAGDGLVFMLEREQLPG